MSDYPEHDRMAAVADSSRVVADFLDWLLEDTELLLAQYNKHDRLEPTHLSIEKLMARYFQIDLSKIDAERRQMLADLRRAQAAPPVEPL